MLTRTLIPLAEAPFDHDFARALPGEAGPPKTPRQVERACWSAALPTPVAAPRLLGWSSDAAATLGLAAPDHREAVAEILAGNRLLPGMRPLAACYGGHQFGQWAGQLGDGRAIVLGDLPTVTGERWEIQLKGAGLTPYSRGADGRAVLRSSLREFVCSEAMHHLGVPTTRALALVGSGETVVRDMFYDGRPQAEPGAIVTRVAPSFVRFGNFEIFAARGDSERLRLLADYVISRHFPELGQPGPGAYAVWFDEIARRTAVLMAHWLRVGFVHGVMNTDNLSILGLTIDYGPFGWLDHFDPDFTPNTSDGGGRYAWNQQPGIAQWNLLRLGEALLPLVDDPECLEGGLETYSRVFEAEWLRMGLAKIGVVPGTVPSDDAALLGELLSTLRLAEVDMTFFFRSLINCDPYHLPADGLPSEIDDSFYSPTTLSQAFVRRLRAWFADYTARLVADGVDEGSRRARMRVVNPCILPRNYLLQQTINQVEVGDLSGLEALLAAVRDPYTEKPELAPFLGKRPEWARSAPGCSALSCSS